MVRVFMMKQNTKTEIRVAIKKGANYFYLLKVIKEGYNVYCTVPRLGIHHSLHESGLSHFRPERTDIDPEKQPPVVIMPGSAGARQGDGFIVTSLKKPDSTCGIYTAIYSLIENMNENNYRRFNRNTEGCFVIDATVFPNNVSGLELGVWSVAKNGETKFKFNNPDIPENLLFKAEQCEPQIWVYARSF